MEKQSYFHVENIAAALVREYLYRKGLQNTLSCMDKETPRTSGSINSRIELVRELKIDRLMNKNREQNHPFRTMMEVIVQHMQEKSRTSRRNRERIKQVSLAVNDGSHDSYILEQIFKLREDPQFNIKYNSDMKRYVIPLPLNLVDSRDVDMEFRQNVHSVSSNVEFNDFKFMKPNHKRRRNELKRADTHPLAVYETVLYKGRNSRGKNGKDEWRSGSEPPSPTNEAPPSPRHKHNQRTCQELGLEISHEQDNALKAKKKILLSSLCPGSGWSEDDNRRRLGPNRYNVFECLQKSPVTSPRAVDECKKFTYDKFQNWNSDDVTGLQNVPERNTIESSSIKPTESPEHKNSPKHNSETNLDLQSGSSKNSHSKDYISVNSEEKNSLKHNSGGKDSTVEVLGSLKLTEDTRITNFDNPDGTSVLESEELTRIKEAKEIRSELKEVPKLQVWVSTKKSNDIHTTHESQEFLHKDEVKQENFSLEKVTQNVDDIELMDLDDIDTVPEFLEISIAHTPISIATAIELKKVVLGSGSATFSPQWLGQGFVFSTNQKLRYGFIQKKGGSCGVLATVQAFVLKILLFEQGACSCTEPLRPTRMEASSALVRALGNVLWRAGLGESAILALSSDVGHLVSTTKYIADGLTERLNLTSFNSREHLETGIKNNLDQFTNTTGNGCLLILFSAVLSRGLHRVKNDMDECSPLIGYNGQCTLELVNLLLTGYAVSNVFDNSLQVDSCWLRGVNTRADIGFLSLFEHFNSCQVGSYLKTPRYPIWVVCSENHFTVLFSCRRELVSDWRAERRFHLYYYDGMARQEDEIKLTVDTTGLQIKGQSEAERVPPLEHCIRTKWKDAVVDWNGYRPVH